MPATRRNSRQKAERAPYTRNGFRKDRMSGFVIGRLVHPTKIEKRGRGRYRLAFDQITRSDGSRGPVTRLGDIPLANLRAYVTLLENGCTSPCTAAAICFGTDDRTVATWLSDGAKADCEDSAKREFYLLTQHARAKLRAKCETRVVLDDPLAALSKSSLGRTDAAGDGWTPRSSIEHTGPGGGAMKFELEISAGYATHEAARELPAHEEER